MLDGAISRGTESANSATYDAQKAAMSVHNTVCVTDAFHLYLTNL